MKSRLAFTAIVLLVGLALWLAAGLPLAAASPRAPFAPLVTMPSPPSEVHVCSACTYTTVQAGVDAVAAGGVVKIAAGVYAGATLKNGLKQVAYINKSVTLDGGYTPSNWTTPDPVANVTTLDAQHGGRVLYITLHGQSATIRGLRLINGDATKANDIGSHPSGGGIFAFNSGAAGSLLTLSNNQISGNTTNGDAAGLVVDYFNLILTGNTISDNVITGANGNEASGGGAYLWFVTTGQITGNTFSNNQVPIDDYYGDSGGGLQVYYSTVTISGNTFQGNQAQNGGGLSELRSSLTVTGNQFLSNQATSGGGVYFGSDNDATITLTLTGNLFHANTVTSAGGGAWLTPYQVNASNNIFDGNFATSNSDSGCQGAGLMVGGSNRLVVEHNQITDNTANASGGGLCLSATPVIQNNLISGNHARDGAGLSATGMGNSTAYNPLLVNNVLKENQSTQDGSAISINGSGLTMIHNTLNHNTGGDASIATQANLSNHYGALSLTNTLFASQATGVSLSHGYTASIDGVLWSGVTTPTKAVDAGSITLSNGRTGSAALASDGFHLLAGSAAIDHGVATSVTRDFDGKVRPVGAAPDLGADEWYPVHIYVPVVKK